MGIYFSLHNRLLSVMFKVAMIVSLFIALRFPVNSAEMSSRSYSNRDFPQLSTYPQSIWLDGMRSQREIVDAKRQAIRESNAERIRTVDPWVADRVEEAARKAELRRKTAEAQHRAKIRAIEENSHVDAPPIAVPPYVPYEYTYPYPYPYP